MHNYQGYLVLDQLSDCFNFKSPFLKSGAVETESAGPGGLKSDVQFEILRKTQIFFFASAAFNML